MKKPDLSQVKALIERTQAGDCGDLREVVVSQRVFELLVALENLHEPLHPVRSKNIVGGLARIIAYLEYVESGRPFAVTVPKKPLAVERGERVHKAIEEGLKKYPDLFERYELALSIAKERGITVDEEKVKQLEAKLTWTKEWPTKEGWYWTCQRSEVSGELRLLPARMRWAGPDGNKWPMYLREGYAFHESEQKNEVWWLPMKTPKLPTGLWKG